MLLIQYTQQYRLYIQYMQYLCSCTPLQRVQQLLLKLLLMGRACKKKHHGSAETSLCTRHALKMI